MTTVKKKSTRSINVNVRILCKALYNGDEKYIEGQEYPVPRKWAESVIKADEDSNRQSRLVIL